MSRKAIPAAKLTAPMAVITIRKPRLLSDRCGVTIAENSAGSTGPVTWEALADVMGIHYRGNMGRKSIKAGRNAGSRDTKSRRPVAKAKKPAASGRRTEWTAAEIETAFSRFRSANPHPHGELEHVDPYTLLVAVV